MPAESYTVNFGLEAWTLKYRDQSGVYIVTFDCDIESLEIPEAKQRIILNPPVHREAGARDSLNLDETTPEVIMSRVKVHLEHIGYEVQYLSQ